MITVVEAKRPENVKRYGVAEEVRKAIATLDDEHAMRITTRHEQEQAYRWAKQAGFRITTQKQKDGGWLVWRVS